MKSIEFLGDSRRVMREFPDEARRHVGAQLYRVQEGKEPSDWKPFPAVGPGVREIRIKEASGAFRVMYLATLPDAVYVLHAFQKKTQKTPQNEIEIAKARFKELKKRGRS